MLYNLKAKRRDTYKCKECGKESLGDPYTVEREGEIDILRFLDILNKEYLFPDLMPVYWSSHLGKNGRIEYKCFNCNDSKDIWWDEITKD